MATTYDAANVDNESDVNSLWPSETIWRHRSELTLAQVMAYILHQSPIFDPRMVLYYIPNKHTDMQIYVVNTMFVKESRVFT